MAETLIQGMGVALVTPFHKDFSIDYYALERVIYHIIQGGADFIVALGTTAETPTLSIKEKRELSKFISDKVGGKIPLVIGIGGNNTYAVVEEIKESNLKGFDAILSVAPFYNKPSQEGIFQHFKTIGTASSLPIIIYNVPGRTGVNITAFTTLRLAELSEQFCAIKEASGNIKQCEEILENKPDHFNVLSGDDALICKLMKIGASGVISVAGNACPTEVKKIVDLSRASKFEEANLQQEKIQRLNSLLFEDGNPAGVKALLSEMGIIDNILRLPLVPVSCHIQREIKKEIEKLGLS